MLNGLRNVEQSHKDYAKSLQQSLGPLEVITKLHLILRFWNPNLLRIRDLSDDTQAQFGLRVGAYIATGVSMLTFLMAFLVGVFSLAGVVIYLKDGNLDLFLNGYYKLLTLFAPLALVGFLAYLIDRVSLHRAAQSVDTRPYREQLKRLLKQTEGMGIPDDTRQELKMALIRYSQAERDYEDQQRVSWLSYVRAHKFDEAGMAKVTCKLISAANAFLKTAKPAIETRIAHGYLRECACSHDTDASALKGKLDAFWQKLVGSRYEASSATWTVEFFKEEGAQAYWAGSIGMAVSLLLSMPLLAGYGACGWLAAAILITCWAVVSAALFHLMSRPGQVAKSCLAWNTSEALALIQSLSTVLLRDGCGQPTVCSKRDESIVACLSAIHDKDIEPSVDEIQKALYLLSERYVNTQVCGDMSASKTLA